MSADPALTVLAHGIGGRADLPIPAGLAIWGSGVIVLVTFLSLILLWRTPRLRGDAAGAALPPAVQRLLDATALRWTLCAVALAASALVLAVALLGPPASNDNLSPYALYITLWVGLIPVSLLLGPVWRVVNPLRTLHAVIARLTGPGRAAHRLPSLGYWPAAASLLAFTWLELVLPGRAEPRTVGTFLVLYAVLQLSAAVVFGAGWFARGDGFEVYSSLIGRLSPLGRRKDGRFVLRSPLDGVDGLRRERGLVAVVMVLVGSTAFDGLSRTRFWTQGPGADAFASVTPGTLGLAATVAVASLLYVGATAAIGALTGESWRPQPSLYAHSLVPIAAGYAVAHYFSLLLLDGQTTWILASNPFGADGVDLFGTYANRVDYTVVGTRTIAWVQVGAIVVGHLLAVVLAHDRAVRRQPRGAATKGQLPLVAVMVAFTVGGLGLLLSS